MTLRSLLQQLAILLALTLVLGTVAKAFHPKAPAWKLTSADEFDPIRISFATIQEEHGGDVLWVDSRTPAEFAAGHVPEALHLSQAQWNDQLFTHLETLTTVNKPIVVYCDGKECALSKKVATELRELGIAEVYYIQGGWEELQAHFRRRPLLIQQTRPTDIRLCIIRCVNLCESKGHPHYTYQENSNSGAVKE